MGLRLTCCLAACERTALSVRPSLRPITRVGVFRAAKLRSCALSALVHAFPCCLVDFGMMRFPQRTTGTPDTERQPPVRIIRPGGTVPEYKLPLVRDPDCRSMVGVLLVQLVPSYLPWPAACPVHDIWTNHNRVTRLFQG